MDEESRGKRFSPEHCICFREEKAGSKTCRETWAESRPSRRELLRWSPKESPSSPGLGVALKPGPGQRQDSLTHNRLFCIFNPLPSEFLPILEIILKRHKTKTFLLHKMDFIHLYIKIGPEEHYRQVKRVKPLWAKK